MLQTRWPARHVIMCTMMLCCQRCETIIQWQRAAAGESWAKQRWQALLATVRKTALDVSE